MNIGWINKLDATAFSFQVTGSGWSTTLPLSNALIAPMGNVARSTGGGTITIDIFWPSMTLRVLGLLNTTISADTVADLRLTMSETAAGGSDFYDSGVLTPAALKLQAGYGQVYIHVPELGLGAGGEGAFYARLTITAVSAIDIGRLVMYGGSGFWEPPRTYNFGAEFDWKDLSQPTRTVGGQSVSRAGARYRQYAFDLTNNTLTAMLDNAFELDRVAGVRGDVLVMLDPVNRPVVHSLWGPLVAITPLIEARGRAGKRFIIEERL